jgi:hypothetical protein
MANRKYMPKETFLKKLKNGETFSMRRNHLLAIKWCDVLDVYTVYDDRMIDAPASEEAHEKNKPLAVMEYNK